MVDQSSSGGNPPTPGQVQDASAHPQTSGGSRGHRSPSPLSTPKVPTKAELLASQSKSMSVIARTMEARTEGKGALLSVKMDIKLEKRKAAKIANLQHARDLGAITDAEFKSQVRAVLGLGAEGATSQDDSAPMSV